MSHFAAAIDEDSDLPADLVTEGAIRIYIRCDGGANAVVGELWLTAGR